MPAPRPALLPPSQGRLEAGGAPLSAQRSAALARLLTGFLTVALELGAWDRCLDVSVGAALEGSAGDRLATLATSAWGGCAAAGLAPRPSLLEGGPSVA